MDKKADNKLDKIIREELSNMTEAATETVDDYIKRLEDAIKKTFPKSFVTVKLNKGLGRSIYVFFTIGKDKSEWSHGIYDNDPMIHGIFIWLPDGTAPEDPMPEKLEAEISRGGSLAVKPEEGSHYAYDRRKIGWRKKKGTPDQIFKHIDNYFKKAMKVWKDNKDNLANSDQHLSKKY